MVKDTIDPDVPHVFVETKKFLLLFQDGRVQDIREKKSATAVGLRVEFLLS